MYPDNQQTEGQPAQYFFPEWVTGVFYGGHWHDVKPESFVEDLPTIDHGTMSVYQDPFTQEMVFVVEQITGFKVKKPVPPEPKATVTPIHREHTQ